MDAAFYRPKKKDDGVTGLGLFAPDIRTDAPAAPGSATSKAAAEAIDGPFRTKSYRKSLTALVASGRPMSREELSTVTGIKESSLCGRLSDRELRPEWVAVVPGACVSAAGVSVDGYVATDATKRRMARRIA
jgi:hypothetical protein